MYFPFLFLFPPHTFAFNIIRARLMRCIVNKRCEHSLCTSSGILLLKILFEEFFSRTDLGYYLLYNVLICG